MGNGLRDEDAVFVVPGAEGSEAGAGFAGVVAQSLYVSHTPAASSPEVEPPHSENRRARGAPEHPSRRPDYSVSKKSTVIV